MKFADGSILAANGICDISIKKENGEHSLIKCLLYILGIKCNILSIEQLLERNYKIHMENKFLKVMDTNGILILKAFMAQNRTFKFELKVIEHRCLAKATSREEWIWHYKPGNLNFKDLDAMQKNNMVTGMPSIDMPTEVCEECVQVKQHRGKWCIQMFMGYNKLSQLEAISILSLSLMVLVENCELT